MMQGQAPPTGRCSLVLLCWRGRRRLFEIRRSASGTGVVYVLVNCSKGASSIAGLTLLIVGTRPWRSSGRTFRDLQDRKECLTPLE